MLILIGNTLGTFWRYGELLDKDFVNCPRKLFLKDLAFPIVRDSISLNILSMRLRIETRLTRSLITPCDFLDNGRNCC